MKNLIDIAVCGADGYVGSELLHLIHQHPSLNLTAILSRTSTDKIKITKPWLQNQNVDIFFMSELDKLIDKIDVLLLATPAQVSIEIIDELKKSNIKIIDLSGAFRLPQQELNQWYDIEHQIPELDNGAQYGLSPWGFQQKTQNNVLANPGCYATAALMALIPLLKNNVIKEENIIIDAKSGTTGAGKTSSTDLMLSEMSENFFPYKVGKHQHIPEINNALFQFSQKSCEVKLITHMLPIARGISMSIYVDAKPELKSDQDISNAINTAYITAYEDYPLIEFCEIKNNFSLKNQYLLSLKNVVGTSKTHISYYVDNQKIFLFTCIDNLLKGAASQAIENINALYHLPLHTGLISKEELL